MTTDTAPLAVGLVGAGGWARTMHAPLHTASGPDGRPGPTRLAGVWAADTDGAASLAAAHGVPVFATYAELLESCEAVDLAVPPAAQPALAIEAAAAGRPMLLEKPLGVDLGAAREVVDAVDEAGVGTVVVFTKRYHPRTREFLAATAALAAKGPLAGGFGCYLHGGFLGGLDGNAATAWRHEYGVLYDLGPHLLDLADAALGRIVGVRADGDGSRHLALTTDHEGGAVGQWALSGTAGIDGVHTRVEVFSEHGEAAYTTAGMDHAACWPQLRSAFAAAARGQATDAPDARRALAVQEILDAAARSLRSGERAAVGAWPASR